jgi:hypothetical protein
MVFWAGILVAACFAYFTSKMGFYQTWAMVFNIVISVYVAIFLTPVIADAIPAATDTAYGYALILLAIVIGMLVTLQGITYALTGQFSVTFPKIFNSVGGGILGFLAGFLVWSFVAVAVSTTPVSTSNIGQTIGFGSKIEQTNVPYISWWCNLVNTIAASKDSNAPQEVINTLLAGGQKKRADKGIRRIEQNKPAEPNGAQKSSPGEKQRSRSRDVGLEDI